MAWRRLGDKPLPEPILTQISSALWTIIIHDRLIFIMIPGKIVFLLRGPRLLQCHYGNDPVAFVSVKQPWPHTSHENGEIQNLFRQRQDYVYTSQVRMPNGRGVRWAECLLIIGTGCRFQIFSLILDSSVGLSAGIHSAGDLVSETLMGSNPAFSRGRQLVSFRFEYRLPVPEHRN